jgi:hypothetical protein
MNVDKLFGSTLPLVDDGFEDIFVGIADRRLNDVSRVQVSSRTTLSCAEYKVTSATRKRNEINPRMLAKYP